MEEWRTDIVRGLTIGIVLILFIFAVDIGLVWMVVDRQAIDLGTFAAGLAILASMGLLALIAYWMYGLADSGYFLDRNQLIIHWGPNEQVIPARTITRVLAGDELPGPVRIAGGTWPGHYFGHGDAAELGPVLFFATVPPRKQVYIVTPGLTYGISPADRLEFLEALRRRLEMGPTQAVEPSSRRPAFLSWGIWRDRLGLGLFGGGLVAALLLTAVLSIASPLLPPEVALHFDASGAPGQLDPRADIFIIPLIGYLALVVNGALGWLIRRYERVASLLLWGGALLVQILAWVAALGVLARQ
jgi:Bacterial PH domain